MLSVKKIGAIVMCVVVCMNILIQPSFADQTDIQQRIQDTLARYEQVKSDAWYFDNSDMSGFDAQQAMSVVNDLGKDISGVVSEIQTIQEKKGDNDANYQEMIAQVKRVVIDINDTKRTVADSVLKINLYNREIASTVKDLQEAREYIVSAKKSLTQLIQLLYLVQNDYYAGAGDIDDIKLLLKSDNISDTLSADEIMNSLIDQFNTLIADLTDHQEKYTEQYNKMNLLRTQYKNTILGYEKKITVLEEQKAYLMSFVKLYKNNKIELNAQMSNLFETKQQLRAKIASVATLIRNHKMTEPFFSSTGYADFLALKDEREQKRNFFLWPVLPVSTIDSYFMSGGTEDQDFPGIVVPAHQYDSLYAPANGVVYKVSDQDGIAINWMMIVHNGGYVTVFTNINRALVKEGEVVKRGQIIGLIGGEQGTRGAGFQGKGEGLYMQLYQNSKLVDPLNELDLSVIPNESVLDEKYHAKYEVDMQLRDSAIKMSDVPFIDGETSEARTRNFLDKYAQGPYRNYNLWAVAAKDTNIDIDLGICIGLAETSLGRYFASVNNIGNVGNDDSGNRVDQSSPLFGARSIYQTLNNSFLGDYFTIYELSGFGNKQGAIYASSPYNWQKNVSRCLSSIKGYIVPEDYPFRTYKTNTY